MRYILVLILVLLSIKIGFNGEPMSALVSFEDGNPSSLTKWEFLSMNIRLIGGWIGYEYYRRIDGWGGTYHLPFGIKTYRLLGFFAGTGIVGCLIWIVEWLA